MVGEGPHHRRVDEIDDAEVRRLGGVAMLDLLDVAEDLALLLRDGQQLAGLDQRVDLLERLGQPGQAAGFVERESAAADRSTRDTTSKRKALSAH
jgi:hypothetical protein